MTLGEQILAGIGAFFIIAVCVGLLLGGVIHQGMHGNE